MRKAQPERQGRDVAPPGLSLLLPRDAKWPMDLAPVPAASWPAEGVIRIKGQV